jgi:hypothetical protein
MVAVSTESVAETRHILHAAFVGRSFEAEAEITGRHSHSGTADGAHLLQNVAVVSSAAWCLASWHPATATGLPDVSTMVAGCGLAGLAGSEGPSPGLHILTRRRRRGPDGECIVAFLQVHGSIPDAGRFRGPFFLVAAWDWFGSQHMGLHSPREAPHVCTV